MLVTDKPGHEKLLRRIVIENNLNEVTYMGVGLGSIVQNRLHQYFFKNTAYSKKKVLVGVLNIWLAVFAKFRFSQKKVTTGKVAFLYYSGEPKDIEIFRDVKQSLEPGSYSENLKNDFFLGFGFKELREWLGNAGRFYRQSARALKILEKSGDINKNQRIVLFHLALSYSLRISKIRSIFKNSATQLMLFTYDRDPICGIIAATANSLGIKTAVIVHGSSFHLPTGYVPVICKDLLCWGPLQKEMFQEYGTDGKRITITGFPKFRDLNSADSALYKKKYGIDASKYVMLLATSPLKNEKDSELAVIASFLKAFENVDAGLQPVIKLHPTRYKLLISKITELYPKALILPADIDKDESLLLADVVFNLTSTYGIEALSAGLPVCVFNPTGNSEEGVGKYLKADGLSRYAANSEELHVILKEAETQNISKVFNTKENLEYFKKICSFTDWKSVNEILEYINKNITKSE